MAEETTTVLENPADTAIEAPGEASEAPARAPIGIRTKGWRGGLLIHMPAPGEWEAVTAELAERMTRTKDFWDGSPTTLDLGDRDLAPEAFDVLVERLKAEFGLEPAGLVSRSEALRKHAEATGLEAFTELPAATPKPAPPDPREQTKYFKGTVRSGVVIETAGNLVVVGDVNAGAEVRAGGDILVFGTLRGVAHAGSLGDVGVQIMATNLRPTQLRIAGLIARSPDGGQPPLSKSPEKALVENGEIQILPL